MEPSLHQLIGDFVSSDSSRQVSLAALVRARIPSMPVRLDVLDLGCGGGRSQDFFRQLRPEAEWTGVDVESSPEVDARRRSDGRFVTFDGIHLPFEDGSFDLVYSNQVLEHVRHPEALLAEVRRVLRPNGRFLGSTSHLEPYHSLSYTCFSPWGFTVLLRGAGLKPLRLHPGIDGLTLILRRLLGRPRFMSRYFRVESPLNTLLEWTGRLGRRSVAERNLSKLQYCGQFRFEAEVASGDATTGAPGDGA